LWTRNLRNKSLELVGPSIRDAVQRHVALFWHAATQGRQRACNILEEHAGLQPAVQLQVAINQMHLVHPLARGRLRNEQPDSESGQHHLAKPKKRSLDSGEYPARPPIIPRQVDT